EALRRIINTLVNKNEELQHFLDSIDSTRTGLQEESCKVMSELEMELEKLSSALEERGVQLRDIIKEETQRKQAELQRQLSEGKFALLSCEELLEFANQTLTLTNEEEFLTAAKQIKERYVAHHHPSCLFRMFNFVAQLVSIFLLLSSLCCC
ncbi:hypothetical protein GOODEAATRI_024836, partial [Goodea atripinnis]